VRRVIKLGSSITTSDIEVVTHFSLVLRYLQATLDRQHYQKPLQLGLFLEDSCAKIAVHLPQSNKAKF